MDVRVKFLGGAGTVTGSKYLLTFDEYQVLIDCGMYQGLKNLRLRNWEDFPVDAAKINTVVITHAHLDHTGYLPKLLKLGFSGKIYCTEATYDIMKIILMDAAKLQEEEANYARKKGYSKHKNPEPLFTSDDVENVFDHVVTCRFFEQITLMDNISIEYKDTGHILGAASVTFSINGSEQKKKITFSGDLGRYDDPVLYDPKPVSTTDVLFIESTYGTKENKAENIEEQLAQIIKDTFAKEGCVVVPAFAVGRTQLLLYYINNMMSKGMIPEAPIYVDSPMAISVTNIYKKYHYLHKLKDDDLTDDVHPIFDSRRIKYCRDHESSYKLNFIDTKAIIISASGMMTGGRILHHLYNRLGNTNDTLLITGHQAKGTRGWRLQNDEKTLRMFGIDVPVKCTIAQLHGLSAHADKTELFKWMSQIANKPKLVFTVHGEEEVLEEYAKNINSEFGWNTFVPKYMESFQLFDNI